MSNEYYKTTWEKSLTEFNRLKVENDTLAERIAQLTMDVSHLKVQNDRYREALENIATLGNIFEEKASAQVAREALNRDKAVPICPNKKGGK
jgi:regulator of replication initiation timing